MRSTPAQLAASIDVLDDLAEVRKAKETATVFVDMGPEDQGEWAKELRDRVTPPSADAPAVCVLDTGVTRGHPLLEASTLPTATAATERGARMITTDTAPRWPASPSTATSRPSSPAHRTSRSGTDSSR